MTLPLWFRKQNDLLWKSIHDETTIKMRRALLKHEIRYWREDKWRQFILLQWSRKFGISFELLVEILVTKYLKKIRKRSGRSNSLGVNLSALTGPYAFDFLQDYFGDYGSKDETYLFEPAKYNSIAQYQQQMEDRRRSRLRKLEKGRCYRNSSNWNRG